MQKTNMRHRRRLARSHAMPVTKAAAPTARPSLTRALSVLSAGLALMGFGTTLALGFYGIDVLEMVSNPVDLIRVSSYPVSQIVDAMIKGQTPWHLVFLPGLAGTLLFLVFWCSNFETWKKPVLAAGRHGKEWLGRMRERRWFGPVAAILFGSAVALLMAAIRPLVILAFAVLIVPVGMGFMASRMYFEDTVLKPERCTPLLTREYLEALRQKQADESPSATCVRVASKSHGVMYGRKIFATSEAIALFLPETGASITIPRKEASVTTVGSLPEESSFLPNN